MTTDKLPSSVPQHCKRHNKYNNSKNRFSVSQGLEEFGYNFFKDDIISK
jgi:hypothetical protein